MATEAQIRANNKYQKKAYERIEIYVRKELELKKKIEKHCLEYGYINENSASAKKTNRVAFITKAIETQMAIDRGEIEIIKKEK